jgi:hypothetical protein
LFGQVGDETASLEKTNKIWEKIESRFEEVNNTWCDSFLRYSSFTRYHHVTNSALFEKISKEVRNFSAEEILQFTEQLRADSVLYLHLRSGKSSAGEKIEMARMSTDASAGLSRLIKALQHFGFPQVYIVLFALYTYARDNSAYLNKDFLFKDVRATFCFVVLAKYSGIIPSKYEKLFANFAGDIHNLKGSETFGSVKSIFFKSLQDLVPESERDGFVSSLIDDICCTGQTEEKITSRNDRDFLGALLRMLEGDDLAVSGTIEHIVPRSEGWREVWSHVVPTFSATLRFKLGNLVLLEEKLNKVSKDEIFEQKATQYKLSRFILAGQLTEITGPYFEGFSSVDPTAVIEARGQKLASDLFDKLKSNILKYGKQ